jgi:lipopolysaccharide heptosyltransferase II
MAQVFPSHNRDDAGYPTQPDPQRKLRNTFVSASKRLLLGAIYLLLSIVGAFLWLQRCGKHYPPLHPQCFHPRRILVLRLDLIGDLVLSLTVVRALKRTYPHAEIDLLTAPGSAPVVTADPDLKEIITYNPNIWRRPQALFLHKNWQEARALLQHLHARHYDLAVSVFGPWAGIMAVLSGARRSVGFGKESYPGFMTDSVPGRHWQPGDYKHEVDYCLDLAQAVGAQPGPDERIPHLFIDARAQQEVEALLIKEGLRVGKPLIACHVSSHNGQAKRWPIPYWARLIDRLIREDGANVVLTGAPQDLPLIEHITQRMSEEAIVLAGKTTLPQLAALMRYADLVISGDSGPMHIAAAVGSSLIAMHGPTDPTLSGPVSPQATILRSDIWCRPCYNARGPANCRFFTTQCMKDITPEQVFVVVHKKLQNIEFLRQSRQKEQE